MSQYFARLLCAIAALVWRVAPAEAQSTGSAMSLAHVNSGPSVPWAQGVTQDAASAGSVNLKKALEHRRETAAAAYARSGERLTSTRQYEAGALEFAVAYALSPSNERLSRVARAFRAADQDRPALLTYQRLLQLNPQWGQQEACLEAIAVLRAKLGSEEDDPFETATLLRAKQEQANALCQQGQYRKCSATYASIYAMKQLPRLLFNMAQANRRSERLDESAILYSRFLEESPPSPLRKEAAQYVSELSVVAFRRPVYKQWWLWTTVLGGLAVAAVASGAAVVSNQRNDPQTALGTQNAVFSLTY